MSVTMMAVMQLNKHEWTSVYYVGHHVWTAFLHLNTFANFWFVLCLVRLGQLLVQIHLPCCPAFYCSMYSTLCFALRIKWWWWWWWYAANLESDVAGSQSRSTARTVCPGDRVLVAVAQYTILLFYYSQYIEDVEVFLVKTEPWLEGLRQLNV